MLLPALVLLAAAPVTLQCGVLTPPLVGAPGDAALRFAQSRRVELGLDARATLVLGRQFSTRFGGSVHLEQQVDGLPVYGARVIVTIDRSQRVVRVASSLKPFGAVKTGFALTHQEALARATHEVDGAWLREDGTPWGGTSRKLFVVNGELHAGYLAFVATPKPSESWHVAIDATDGSVLFVQDRARAANEARVYASSPGGVNAGVGVTATIDTTLAHLPADGGYLTGEYVRALNCCPTAGCALDAGPARATGQSQTFQGVINFDVAICDQRQRATNDPAINPTGSYVYAPVDPPNTVRPSINNPADWDEFAEVHAYYHVSKAYDYVRGLSAGPFASDAGLALFRMRETGPGGDLPAVWVNVADPDFQSAQPNASGVYVSNTLSRTSNAMYLARENMEALLLPPQVLASDALVIYQGAAADFAYDGPVLWHEFGHGVVHSTSDFIPNVTLDSLSANDESVALNEGMADVIAALTGRDPIVGAYVGPRIDPDRSAIRNVDNQDRCPDVLWGESHQDSLHFTGAVWEARSQFLGLDNGETYAAALYAALVSFPVDLNFEKASTIVSDAVAQAFPEITDARARMQAVFTARGVIGCSKVLDITDSLSATRPYFGLPGTLSVNVTDGNAVPGPIQFKIRVPRGAKSASLTGLMQVFGGSGSRIDFMAASGRPVNFARASGTLVNDAQAHATPTVSQGNMTGKVDLAVPCGGELYLAIGNTSRRDRAIYELGFSFEQADSCPEPVVDAGTPEPQPVTVPLAAETLGDRPEGCGCTAVNPLALLAGLAWVLRRRDRR